MKHSMKGILAVVALGTVLAAPAFAQSAPNARQDIRTSHQQRSTAMLRTSQGIQSYPYILDSNPDRGPYLMPWRRTP
jgi:hypothetical protein